MEGRGEVECRYGGRGVGVVGGEGGVVEGGGGWVGDVVVARPSHVLDRYTGELLDHGEVHEE